VVIAYSGTPPPLVICARSNHSLRKRTVNTWKLHQVLERSREAGKPVPSDEVLAHIVPIAFRHIDFQGIYRFPLDRYLDRLVPSVPQKVVAGAK
jgi:hypothetical protein